MIVSWTLTSEFLCDANHHDAGSATTTTTTTIITSATQERAFITATTTTTTITTTQVDTGTSDNATVDSGVAICKAVSGHEAELVALMTPDSPIEVLMSAALLLGYRQVG